MTTSQVFAQPTIRVKHVTEVQNIKSITLGLISEFQNVPKPLQDKLRSVVLGNAPQTGGEKRVFSSSAIAMAFRKHLNKNELQDLKLVIPNEVLISVKNHNLNNKNVSKELLAIWQNYCGDCSFKIQYLNMPLISNIHDVEDWSLDVGKDLPRGSFNVAMYVKLKKQNVRNFWVTGQAKVYRKVPVVKKAMAVGERFNKDNVEIQEKEITYAYDSTPEVNDVYGLQSTQALRPGAIIWQGLVLREKAMVRGEIVKLVIGNEVFEMSTLGKVESDAYIGDRVQVKNLQTNKILTGSVTAKGEVRLE
ncbi:MAG: flagellar basal body P-ring formation protein FlgA [Bdellovibrionales bacterium]|nr:flagellar basal body P-ring formation protein FlgA [Bdellovibrionales bacterium]